MIVYRITNLVNGKVYIGQTTKPKLLTRWREHVWFSKASKYRVYKSALQQAIRKYGFDKFLIEPLHHAYSRKELNAMETFFIILHQSHKPENGYNMTLGGETPTNYWKGKKRSPETIVKIIATKRKNGTIGGWSQTPETIASLVATRRKLPSYGNRVGYKHRPETIEKMSQAAVKHAPANPFWLNSTAAKVKRGKTYSQVCTAKNGRRRKEAAALREQGLSFPRIAKQLGVSISTAFFWASGKVDDGERRNRLQESISGTL